MGKCKIKSRKFEPNERKFSELEKRQLHLISRLDEAEKKLYDLFSMHVLGADEFSDAKVGVGSIISDGQSEQMTDAGLTIKGRYVFPVFIINK